MDLRKITTVVVRIASLQPKIKACDIPNTKQEYYYLTTVFGYQTVGTVDVYFVGIQENGIWFTGYSG